MAAGTRLAIGTAIVLTVTAYMAYVGASSSWQYYLTVDECLTLQSDFPTRSIRISGDVLPGSLLIAANRIGAKFELKGTHDNLPVSFEGRVPDNFAEGQQVVVEGCLQSPLAFHADTVLTRCSSKYTTESTPRNAGNLSPGKTE
ncbi:MAG: cytochrome c maturation protein CcmE [Planctomycetales bacterium]|nr:cytochrome c maturation protein CcmE [Planctomycetales bacterium]